MVKNAESCSEPGITKTSKIRWAGKSIKGICLPSENSKMSRFGCFDILKTASASGPKCNDFCSLSENRNKTLVPSIRQTGIGLEVSSSLSQTTQFARQCICLIPRRCPALASAISLACSAEYQHIDLSSNLEIEPTIESFGKTVTAPAPPWGAYTCPGGREGEDVAGVADLVPTARFLRSEFGARPGSSVALSSSQTRIHNITTGSLDQGGTGVSSRAEHSGLHEGADSVPRKGLTRAVWWEVLNWNTSAIEFYHGLA